MKEMTYDELVKQIRQQEEVIAQLLEKITVINGRLLELERKQSDQYLLT